MINKKQYFTRLVKGLIGKEKTVERSRRIIPIKEDGWYVKELELLTFEKEKKIMRLRKLFITYTNYSSFVIRKNEDILHPLLKMDDVKKEVSSGPFVGTTKLIEVIQGIREDTKEETIQYVPVEELPIPQPRTISKTEKETIKQVESDWQTIKLVFQYYQTNDLNTEPKGMNFREKLIVNKLREDLIDKNSDLHQGFLKIQSDEIKKIEKEISEKEKEDYNEFLANNKEARIKEMKKKVKKEKETRKMAKTKLKKVAKVFDQEETQTKDSKSFIHARRELLSNKACLTSIGKGNIDYGRKIVERLLEIKWYRSKELDPDEAEILKRAGYTKSGNNEVFSLQGKPESVIAFIEGYESLQHLSYKYLFAEELKEYNPQIEYISNLSKDEIDIKVEHNGKKAAIEIETSKKTDIRIAYKKIELEREFDKIFYATRKSDLKSYESLSSPKVFVGTFGEVLSKVREYLEST